MNACLRCGNATKPGSAQCDQCNRDTVRRTIEYSAQRGGKTTRVQHMTRIVELETEVRALKRFNEELAAENASLRYKLQAREAEHAAAMSAGCDQLQKEIEARNALKSQLDDAELVLGHLERYTTPVPLAIERYFRTWRKTDAKT